MKCGLLGKTLAHSRSPAIHAAFGDYSYELFEVQPKQLADFFTAKNFDAINVTIPYKQAVLPFCRHLSPEAAACGSVNAIVKQRDGSLFGHNTDVCGFLAMIGGIKIEGQKVLILGDGGSARAVQAALKGLRAARITLIGRKDNNPAGLAPHFDADVLINTTPVGMYPATGGAPVDLSKFAGLKAVLDLIYNPIRTRLLIQAQKLEIPHFGGLSMLVAQAAASSALFTGQKIDVSKQLLVAKTLAAKMENIVLIGMPGSGKTTVGLILANLTGRPFIDTDRAIEKDAGLLIPEIFSAYGEEGFRACEINLLDRYGKEQGQIIATGGGCVTALDNYYHLRQNGTIFLLERNVNELAREGRPLSQNADLKAMHAAREPLYRAFADYRINNDCPQATSRQILEVFNENFGNQRPKP